MVQITARLPIARRLAIYPTVIAVSARKRAAKATFTDPLGPSFEISFLPPPRFNSSAMISYASASDVSARSSP